MQPLLRIQNLSVDFSTGGRVNNAVKNISFEVNKGEILALVGESGSGKSVTSLSILKLLPQPPARFASGKILFSEDGIHASDLLQANDKLVRSIRGHKIAMIFQEPMTSLNPVMNCGTQVMEALLVHKKISRQQAKQQTIEWFEKVRLPEPSKIFHRYPHQLSGGQKQRVMIAMAMSCAPSLLICDEPTTALDVTVQKTILELIRDLQKEEHMGVVFITHDLGVVSEIADRVAIMYKGEIVEQNSTHSIFTNPQHPYTKALIACRPALRPKEEKLPTVSDFLALKDQHVQPSRMITKKIPTGKILLEAQNLSVQFPSKAGLFGKPVSYVTAVDKVSFRIMEGETLGLVGESGCGKTTLGRTLLHLIEPTGGSIIYGGKDMTKLSKEQARGLRKNIQLVFQDPYSSLNPRLTIGSAIAEPMKVAGLGLNEKERRRKVAALLERVDLPPSMMERYPHEFSGGQRQRIVIARALALNPGFLVCDESVSALDVSVQAQVLNLLNELKNSLGLTMLFISHDLSVVRYMCDRILVMNRGRIEESGPAEEVYLHPKSEYTKKLIQAIPGL
ncbi:MAG TPA: ABC transporter ATP-binding protein [Flavisolibacter sp.]|nr:ABC transporter ATP-binding protein [Flavisolibacter sp.]